MIDLYKVGAAFETASTLRHPTTSAASNADGTPTASATRNGTAITWALTVAQTGPTGRYVVTGTVPTIDPPLAPGDRVEVFLAATVAGTPDAEKIGEFRVLSPAVYDCLFGTVAPSTLTAAGVANAVWNEARASHTTAGTFGEALQAEASGGGSVQAATSTTVQLGTGEPTTTDYRGWGLSIYSGKGAGQFRTLSAYVPATRTGTVDKAWETIPDTTSVYLLRPPVAVSDKTGFMLSPTGVDAIAVEAGVNMRQALSPILASAAGVLSGAATSSINIKGGNSNITRISANVDNDGNRTAVTLNLPS